MTHTPETIAALLAGTTAGAETETYEITWHVEIGQADGNGVGSWEGTTESVPFVSRLDAEALRDLWLASGKLTKMPWGELRPTNHSYGLFRIRRASTLIAAAPTLATELLAALVREKALREALVDVVDALGKFVDTSTEQRKPYENPLSAYDRAVAALAQEDQG